MERKTQREGEKTSSFGGTTSDNLPIFRVTDVDTLKKDLERESRTSQKAYWKFPQTPKILEYFLGLPSHYLRETSVQSESGLLSRTDVVTGLSETIEILPRLDKILELLDPQVYEVLRRTSNY